MDTVLRKPCALKGGNRLDFIRVLLTIGIVCRHATSNNLQVVVWLTDPCVPLFFALSGYLFFANTPQQPDWKWFWAKLRSRFFTLVIPYIIANVIAWLCFYFAITKVPSMVSGFFGDQWRNPLFVFWTGPVNMSLWFIRELIVVVLLSPLIWFLLRYTRWWGVLALGVLWAFKIGPAPLFFFSAGACLGLYKIQAAEKWMRAPSRTPVESRAWTYFIYLYHYLLLIGLKKGLSMLIPSGSLWADIAVWLISVITVIFVLTTVYALLRRMAPRFTGILVGGK